MIRTSSPPASCRMRAARWSAVAACRRSRIWHGRRASRRSSGSRAGPMARSAKIARPASKSPRSSQTSSTRSGRATGGHLRDRSARGGTAAYGSGASGFPVEGRGDRAIDRDLAAMAAILFVEGGIGREKSRNPRQETRKRKPEKSREGHVEAGRRANDQLRRLHTPRPLPPLPRLQGECRRRAL